jgi:hypothetical protein
MLLRFCLEILDFLDYWFVDFLCHFDFVLLRISPIIWSYSPRCLAMSPPSAIRRFRCLARDVARVAADLVVWNSSNNSNIRFVVASFITRITSSSTNELSRIALAVLSPSLKAVLMFGSASAAGGLFYPISSTSGRQPSWPSMGYTPWMK